MLANHTKLSMNDSLDDVRYVNVTEVMESINQSIIDESCYGRMSEAQMDTFYLYEAIIGGYLNCLIGTLGLIGNIVAIVVLSQKEMRKNCFSQLLIGKDIDIQNVFFK